MTEEEAGAALQNEPAAAPIDVDEEEVDRVIAALNDLMEKTSSPAILEILEGACCDLAELVEVDDEEDEEPDAAV